MLKSSFIHAPGVGAATEKSIWSQGVLSWDSYLNNHTALRIAPRHRDILLQTIDDSVAALDNRRTDYFARNLAAREHWRAISEFRNIGFLDIETDGGVSPGSITMIGLYDGCETRTYIAGENLDQFAYDCQDYDGFVTFFGTGFDLPFLRRRFPVLANVFADRLHIDLCPLLRRLGHRGGLKKIEVDLGIARIPETEGLSGYDAVRLWQHARGSSESAETARRLLIAYNREDVVNMKTLLDYALPRLTDATGYTEHGHP